MVNKNNCVLCLGVVAARTNAVLCTQCAVNKVEKREGEETTELCALTSSFLQSKK